MKNVLEIIKSGWNKVREVIVTHKGTTIGILCGVLLITVVATIGLKVAFSNKGKEETQEERLTRYLEEMGAEFYENFYYDSLSENQRKEFLQKYSEIGIKVNLDNLSRFNGNQVEEKVSEFKNGEQECDKENTKVIIYPQDEFNKKDYKLETILVCGFEE